LYLNRISYLHIEISAKTTGAKLLAQMGKPIVEIQELPIEMVIKTIRNKLNYYQPKKVRRVEIPNDNGKTRLLGILSIWDRVIQQCVLQVLEPICEAKFHERNNRFKPYRSMQNAIAQCYKIEGNCDTTLFLGGKERTTLKEMAEILGKETIDLYNISDTRGMSQSYGLNYQKTEKDMPYLFVKSWLPKTKINGTGTRSADNSANHVFFISFYLVQFCTSEKVYKGIMG